MPKHFSKKIFFSNWWATHKKLLRNSGTGFTLLEIIVVIGIIGLISAIALVNVRGGEEGLSLERVTHFVAQDLRATSERALMGQPFSCTSGSVSGYGMYFDTSTPNSYLVFAECNGNNQYDSGQDEIVENMVLEGNIEVASLAPADPLSIIFTPPDPSVVFNGSGSVAQIILAPEGVFTPPFSYEDSGTSLFWRTPRASCDTTTNSVECPSSFPASDSDPNVVYDQYCGFFFIFCWIPLSQEFTKQTGVPTTNQRLITINERGAIDID